MPAPFLRSVWYEYGSLPPSASAPKIYGSFALPASIGVIGSAEITVPSTLSAAFGGNLPEMVRAYTFTANGADATIGDTAGVAPYVVIKGGETFQLFVVGKSSRDIRISPGASGSVRILAWE